jgi:hypothetical protein
MSDTNQSTGHRYSSSVHGWVCVSILFPFFWFTKVMVIYSAFVARFLSQWSRSALVANQKTTPFSTIILVFPGFGVFASAFGKERGANDKVCGNGRGCVLELNCSCAVGLKHFAQQFGGDGFLSSWGGVNIVVRLE